MRIDTRWYKDPLKGLHLAALPDHLGATPEADAPGYLVTWTGQSGTLRAALVEPVDSADQARERAEAAEEAAQAAHCKARTLTGQERQALRHEAQDLEDVNAAALMAAVRLEAQERAAARRRLDAGPDRGRALMAALVGVRR